ncbi:MAG: hypothetical protein HYY23_07930 [Verrucomicrobia bacterium]|nr:hypothetical protein [Verrucomicrobiota bacterium]
MEPWKVVLDEVAFQYLISINASERRRLLSVFDDLRNNPHRRPDYFIKDAAERDLSVWATKPFLITYWLDSFVSEVRVVNIERLRF